MHRRRHLGRRHDRSRHDSPEMEARLRRAIERKHLPVAARPALKEGHEMKKFTILAVAGALALLGLVALASAGTASGTTEILGQTGGPYDGVAHEDTPTDVELTISTGAPVVPYEYSLINKCWFDGKTS